MLQPKLNKMIKRSVETDMLNCGTHFCQGLHVGEGSSSELETNLFSGEDVLPDDIDFQFCVYGSGATFTAVADDNNGCIISLNRNGSPSRSGCN